MICHQYRNITKHPLSRTIHRRRVYKEPFVSTKIFTTFFSFSHFEPEVPISKDIRVDIVHRHPADRDIPRMTHFTLRCILIDMNTVSVTKQDGSPIPFYDEVLYGLTS